MKWESPVIVAALLLAACRGAVSDTHEIDQPVIVDLTVDGTVARLTLTERAAERLDITTVPVEQHGDLLVVPTGALFVDPDGAFWVYTNPEYLVFLRHQVGLVSEEGDRAFLSDGPVPGMLVVTVGVPELYGAEFGIGK